MRLSWLVLCFVAIGGVVGGAAARAQNCSIADVTITRHSGPYWDYGPTYTLSAYDSTGAELWHHDLLNRTMEAIWQTHMKDAAVVHTKDGDRVALLRSDSMLLEFDCTGSIAQEIQLIDQLPQYAWIRSTGRFAPDGTTLKLWGLQRSDRYLGAFETSVNVESLLDSTSLATADEQWAWPMGGPGTVMEIYAIVCWVLEGEELKLLTGYRNPYADGSIGSIRWFPATTYRISAVTGEILEPGCLKGDLNSNGVANGEDVYLLMYSFLHRGSVFCSSTSQIPPNWCPWDVNSDGRIDIEDPIDILRDMAGYPRPDITARPAVHATRWRAVSEGLVKPHVHRLVLEIENAGPILGYNVEFYAEPFGFPGAVHTPRGALADDSERTDCPYGLSNLIVVTASDSILTDAHTLALDYRTVPDRLFIQAGRAVGPSGILYEWPDHTVELSGIPTNAPVVESRTQLSQNRPNPFNPATEILFELPVESGVALAVFDASGRLVRRLIDARYLAGEHRVVWDGRDDAGRAAASGVYWYRLKTADGERVRRMVLVR